MNTSTETFDQDVIERSHEQPVLVDFWAAWCGPCHALAPVLEAETSAREVTLRKLDVDANPELASRYGIRGIPTVIAFKDGQVVDEFVGALPRAAVGAFLDRVASPSPAVG